MISPKPRTWWHWTLFGIVIAGIIGFVLQMRLSDPVQLSLQRLQFLIAYAIVLFVCSFGLGILEWMRYRMK